MANYPTNEEIIRTYSKEMNDSTRAVFASEYNSRKKDTVINFLLVFFLGRIGVHKLYLEQVGMFVLYLLTFGIFGIGALYDLFTFKAAVFHFNDNLARDLRLKYLRASEYPGSNSSSSSTNESGLPGFDDVFTDNGSDTEQNGDDFDPFE